MIKIKFKLIEQYNIFLHRIPANRIVLVSACQYFLTMFTISLCEANSNEVQFYDISGQTLEQIVKFCYTGRV